MHKDKSTAPAIPQMPRPHLHLVSSARGADQVRPDRIFDSNGGIPWAWLGLLSAAVVSSLIPFERDFDE